MSTVVIRPIEVWLVTLIMYVLGIIITVFILKNECKSRQSKKDTNTTKMLEILPILTMIIAIISNVFGVGIYLNGSCHISYQMWIASSCYFNFMGLYQLSRLHYVFVSNKVHSKQGYPKWLIYLMYIIGIFTMINTPLSAWLCIKSPIICGINKQYQYVEEYCNLEGAINSYAFCPNIFAISPFTYFLWDIITLSLYTFKVISFRKYKSGQNNGVYQRIMSILNRILILTIFYEMPWILYTVNGIFFFLFPSYNIIWIPLSSIASVLSTVTTSYSIVLMQHHNTSKYNKCLKISYKMGVYHICCCCLRSIVENEIEINAETVKPIEPIEQKINQNISILETTGISVKEEMTVRNFSSIETTLNLTTINIQ